MLITLLLSSNKLTTPTSLMQPTSTMANPLAVRVANSEQKTRCCGSRGALQRPSNPSFDRSVPVWAGSCLATTFIHSTCLPLNPQHCVVIVTTNFEAHSSSQFWNRIGSAILPVNPELSIRFSVLYCCIS